MKLTAKYLVSIFALVCVAATSGFLAYMAWLLNQTLSSPEWCSKALQAERISSQNFGGLTACVDLLTIQLKSLATNSHIVFGVFALCLLVLIVIVISGGNLSFTASRAGVSANLGKDEVGQAAQQVADEAQVAADDIKGEA